MGLGQNLKRWLRTWFRQQLLNLLSPLDSQSFSPSQSLPEDALKQRHEVEINLKNQQLQIYQQQNKALLEILKIMAENPTPNISASSGSFGKTAPLRSDGAFSLTP